MRLPELVNRAYCRLVRKTCEKDKKEFVAIDCTPIIINYKGLQ